MFKLTDDKGLMIPSVTDGTTITLNEGNEWTYNVTGLPRKAAGQDIVYSVVEVSTDSNYVQEAPQVSPSSARTRRCQPAAVR